MMDNRVLYQPHLFQGYPLRMILMLNGVHESKTAIYMLTWCKSFSSLKREIRFMLTRKLECVELFG